VQLGIKKVTSLTPMTQKGYFTLTTFFLAARVIITHIVCEGFGQ